MRHKRGHSLPSIECSVVFLLVFPRAQDSGRNVTVLRKYMWTEGGTECRVPGTRMVEEDQTSYLIPWG